MASFQRIRGQSTSISYAACLTANQASSRRQPAVTRLVISVCLRLLFDLDRFAWPLATFSLCRFRFCPEDEEERGFLLIPNPLNKSLVLDWLSQWSTGYIQQLFSLRTLGFHSGAHLTGGLDIRPLRVLTFSGAGCVAVGPVGA